MITLAFLAACSGSSGTIGGPDAPVPAPPAPAPAPTTAPSPVPGTDPAPAEPLPICINELVPDNEHGWTDETGADPDWIELHNPGAADVSLDGWRLGDDGSERDGAPLDGLVVPAGGFLVLAADGLPELGPTHLDFSLGGDGDEVALWAPDDRGAVVAYGATASDRALARESDCCVGACWVPTLRATPGESNAGSFLPSILVDRGAAWRYLDGNTPPPAGWFGAAFDDSAWATGPAPLGYGDPVATAIAGGDPAARPTTAWFRTAFDVPDPSALSALRMRLRYDDGAVVYLNGVRIFGANAPETPGAYGIALREPPLEEAWHEAEVWRNALVPGANVLAAAVWQGAADSDDLRFELELRASP